MTPAFPKTYIGNQLQQTAKLISGLSKSGDVERAMFFTSTGGFDTHNTFDLSALFGGVDSAVGAFANEMKAQGLWDDVVIMSVSDFGRTLASNGLGTDHAWGGNHFVAGGQIAGGQILGNYPDILTDDSPYSFGRGRLVPTSPFEAIWKPLAEWLGVSSSQLAKVLPNFVNFPASQLFSQTQVFEATTTTTTTPDTANAIDTITVLTDEPTATTSTSPSTVTVTSSSFNVETFPGWAIGLLVLASVALVLIGLFVIVLFSKKREMERF